MNQKCIDCYHFKTKVITKEKLIDEYHKLRASFIGKVEDTGGARIWWCDKEQLPHRIYTEKYYVEKLVKENCQFREE